MNKPTQPADWALLDDDGIVDRFTSKHKASMSLKGNLRVAYSPEPANVFESLA